MIDEILTVIEVILFTAIAISLTVIAVAVIGFGFRFGVLPGLGAIALIVLLVAYFLLYSLLEGDDSDG